MSDRISFFLKRLEESEGNLLNRFSLAQAYFESGDYDHSIKHLSICVTERKDWMFAFLLMAKAFLALQKFEDARAALEKTIDMRIPLTFNGDDCDIISSIIIDEVNPIG